MRTSIWGRRAVAAAVIVLVATAWGLAVSIGASRMAVRDSELPGEGFAGSCGSTESVVALAWGEARDQAGITYEGETRGPASFGVDDRGRVYLLDQVKQRVVRFANHSVDVEYSLPHTGFDDIAVERDRFAVLHRFDERSVLLFDAEEGLVASCAIDAAVPDVLRMRIAGDTVYVECPGSNTMAYHAICRLDGTPVPAERQIDAAFHGVPLPNGNFVRAKKLDRNNIAYDVIAPGGDRQAKVRVHSSRDLASIVDVFGDGNGNVLLAYALYRESAGQPDQVIGKLVLAKYDSEGRLIASAETVSDDSPEANRRVSVAENGDVYQLAENATGVQVLRWTLAPASSSATRRGE